MPGGRVKITSCATSSVLEIIRLDYDDEAVYTCYITNSMGSDSASMTLNMRGESCDRHVTVHETKVDIVIIYSRENLM